MAEVLQTGEIFGVPEQLQAWEELDDETEYLTFLLDLENDIEDQERLRLRAEAEQSALDHAALVLALIPAAVAGRMVGYDAATHAQRLADADAYTDPRRRTIREG